MNLQLLQLACSGPYAMMHIAESGIIAMGMYGIAWVMVLALAYDACRLGFTPNTLRWSAVLLVLHPGLWMGTTSGDCGYMARDGSVLFTCLIGGILALHALLTFGRRPEWTAIFASATNPGDSTPPEPDAPVPSPPKPQ